VSELAANGRLDDNVYYIWLHRSALQCRMSLLEWTNFVQFFCYRHLGGRLFLVIYDSTEKRSTARREPVYVGVRAQPAPPHIPLPATRGDFFSVHSYTRIQQPRAVFSNGG